MTSGIPAAESFGQSCESDYIIGLTNREPSSRNRATKTDPSSSLTSTTMRFGLAIGTERAKALEVSTSSTVNLNSITHSSLQNAIQDELMKRGYSVEPGPFLAAFES